MISTPSQNKIILRYYLQHSVPFNKSFMSTNSIHFLDVNEQNDVKPFQNVIWMMEHNLEQLTFRTTFSYILCYKIDIIFYDGRFKLLEKFAKGGYTMHKKGRFKYTYSFISSFLTFFREFLCYQTICNTRTCKELCVSITLYDQLGNRHYNILYSSRSHTYYTTVLLLYSLMLSSNLCVM